MAPETPVAPKVRLLLEATDLCWVQYSLDGQAAAQADLQPGDTLGLEAERTINLVAGNAGAIRIRYHQAWLEDLGPEGRPVRLTFPEPVAAPPNETIPPP